MRARLLPSGSLAFLATAGLLLTVGLVVARELVVPVLARADGDPASDVLLGENVFYPYSPPVSTSLQHRLDAITAAAARAGLPLKVALIASAVDLGVIPDLFNKPSVYARFLDQEISFQHAQPLLVVMPAGYGVAGLQPALRAAAAALPRPRGQTSNDLATAALAAVAKLSEVAGHPVAAPSASGSSGSGTSGSSSSGGSGGGSPALIVILAVLAAVVAAVFIGLTLRDRATRRGRPPE